MIQSADAALHVAWDLGGGKQDAFHELLSQLWLWRLVHQSAIPQASCM